MEEVGRCEGVGGGEGRDERGGRGWVEVKCGRGG